MRVATNDDIAFLMKGGDPTQAAAKGVASEKKKVSGWRDGWFKSARRYLTDTTSLYVLLYYF